MDQVKKALIRMAATLPVGSSERQSVLKVAREFSNEKALKQYLDDHPKADPKNHSVKEKGKKKPKDDDEPLGGKGGILDVDESKFEEKTEASDDDIAQFKDNASVKALGEDFNLQIVAGDDNLTTGDLYRAAHVAAQLHKGIDKSADYCKLKPSACKGNLGITRDNMPQVMEASVKSLLRSDEDRISGGKFKGPDGKKVAFDELPEASQKKLKGEWADERRKGQAAVDAGADPDEDRSTQQIWLDTLKDDGIDINDDEIEVGKLIASQAEIKAKKSYEIAKEFLTGKFKNLPDLPILVARDPKTGEVTVIDGHHRYAGLLTADPHRKMKVRVIEAPIREALERAFNVPGVFRADLQDNIVDSGKPLDLARKPGSAWQQKGKWYAKNNKKKLGGPFKSKDAANAFAKGKKSKGKGKKGALVRLASVLPQGTPERRALLALALRSEE